MTELKKLSAECAFETLKDSLVMDMVIVGVNDNGLRERMLRESDLDLPKAIKLGQAAEEAKKHIRQLASDTSKVNKVYKKKSAYSRERFHKDSGPSETKGQKCKYCGGKHSRGKCPAYGQQCHKCKRKNHFSKCYLSKINMVEESCWEESQQYKDDSSPEEEEFIIQSVEIGQGLDEIVSESFAEDWNHGDESMVVSKETSDVDEETHTVHWKVIGDCEDAIRCEIINRIASTDETHGRRVHGVYQWTANLPTNGKYIKFKLDTGAEVNVLPKNVFDKLHPRPKLSRSAVKLSAYNNSVASVQHEGKVYKVLFMVVKSNTTPILGLNACQRRNLLQRVHMVVVDEDLSFKNEVLNEFSDCFGEMGTLDTT